MRNLLLLSAVLPCLLFACQRGEGSSNRLETLENRVQATEFQMATLAEMEPRMANMISMIEGKFQEWATGFESARTRVSNLESRLLGLEQRLEQAEEWIREKQKENENPQDFAVPDGQVPDAWRDLWFKCAMKKAGKAQTTLNFLVRVDRYMSEFPVHHGVELDNDDPMMCMTSNMAQKESSTRAAYRDRELAILKDRDQWLGYRIDRSWQSRPERGECRNACCKLADDGQWTCDWGYGGGRWECEYDIEGWRNYNRRWHRSCEFKEGTRDFYNKPYLMRKMEQKGVDIPEALFCVVDLVWENRVYCLSHSQYPVWQIRLPEDPENPSPKPLIPRFTLLRITNWDVLYKDEWTSSWILTGVEESRFEGQRSGLDLAIIEEPECCDKPDIAPNPNTPTVSASSP